MNGKVLLCLIAVCLLVGTVSADQIQLIGVHDGISRETTDGSWTSIRNGAGDYSSDSSVNFFGAQIYATSSNNVYNYNDRGIISFNGSILNNTIIIDSASLFVFPYDKDDGVGSGALSIVDIAPGNYMNIADGDYDSTTWTRMASDIPYGDFVLESWLEIPLNSEGIAKISRDGLFGYAFTTEYDVDNTSPAWSNTGWTKYFCRPLANATYKTYLNVTYHYPDYYAYGDSITKATTAGGDLNPDGTDSYVVQMRDNHDISASAWHNFAPTASTSAQGLANISNNYDPGIGVYILEFGVNDNGADPTGGAEDWNATAANLISMKEYAEGNGSRVILSMILLRDTADETDRIAGIQANLTDRGVCYSRTWDALDSNPYNGVLDSYDDTYFIGGVHPNKTGQYLMGEYFWGILNETVDEVCPGEILPDTEPPASITNLANVTTCNSISWNWTDSISEDADVVQIWQNGTFLHNVSANQTYDLWEGLAELTEYEFASHTCDFAGNCNETWANRTSTTGTCATPTPTPTPTPEQDDAGFDGYAHFNFTAWNLTPMDDWNWSVNSIFVGNGTDPFLDTWLLWGQIHNITLFVSNATDNRTISQYYNLHNITATPTPKTTTWMPDINPSTEKDFRPENIVGYWWIPTIILVLYLLFRRS